jgi:hypothetical protein
MKELSFVFKLDSYLGVVRGKINEWLSLTLKKGIPLPSWVGAVNNSIWSQAPFSLLEVELIKIAWVKGTGEEIAGILHISC